MSQTRSAIPRYRPVEGAALFRHGFRPFFLGAGLSAFALLALWLPFVSGALVIPTAFDPVAWHVHELLFGYLIAAIAGFLLTAIPNWTGRMPLQGWPLAGLFAVWVAGRIAVAFSALTGPGLAAAVDLAFLVLLLAAVMREIVAGKNWRNLPMPLALTLLLVANGLAHADVLGWSETGEIARRTTIAVIVALIGLIGGRIVPSFTRNWMAKLGLAPLPSPMGAFDKIAIALLVAALVSWIAVPDHRGSGALLILAAVTTFVRVARWRGYRTLREPLLWSLHLGMLWVPVGLGLLGLAIFNTDLPPSAGVHALTAGAMGGMTLAVMTRATLGHSGRPLSAGPLSAAIYGLVSAAAGFRVAAALDAGPYDIMLHAAAASWLAAFALFIAIYGRILLSR